VIVLGIHRLLFEEVSRTKLFYDKQMIVGKLQFQENPGLEIFSARSPDLTYSFNYLVSFH